MKPFVRVMPWVLLVLAGAASAQKVYSTVTPPPVERVRALSVVNLRAGPGTDHDVVGRIARGAWFEVRDCHVNPGWCEVIVPGPDPAYVSSAHVQRLGAEVPAAPAALPAPATVPIVVVVEPRGHRY